MVLMSPSLENSAFLNGATKLISMSKPWRNGALNGSDWQQGADIADSAFSTFLPFGYSADSVKIGLFTAIGDSAALPPALPIADHEDGP